MARRGIALIGVLALLFFGACSNDKNTNSVRVGYIEGKVTIDGVGIPGVVVAVSAYRVTDNGPGKVSEESEAQGTGSDGDYSVDLLPGQYRVDYTVEYYGAYYATARYPIDVAADAHVTINVELKDPVPANLIARDDNVSVYLSFYQGYGITEYNIYRAIASSNDFQIIATLTSSNAIVYTIDHPSQIGAYKYKVTGIIPNGETDFSNEAFVNFTATIAPPAFFMADDNLTNVELNWADNHQAVSYKIYRAVGTGNWSLLATTTSNNYVDIPSGYNTYKYRVTAVSSYGTESAPSVELTINYDGRLEPPAGFSVSDHGNILYLSWSLSGHDSQYNIYRSLVADDDFVKIDSTDEHYYSDRPPLNHTYYYRVSAVAPNGLESGLSQVDYASFDGLLEPPVSIQIRDYGLYLMLTWDPIDFAGAYILYRSDDGGTVYNQIARVNAYAATYADSPLSAGDKYYKIATETADGTLGPLSNPYSIHFNDNLLPPSDLRAQNLGLRTHVFWIASTGATSYTAYRAPHADGDYVIVSDNVDSNDILDEPTIQGSYYYRIVAKDNAGHESPMSDYAYVYYTNYPEPPAVIGASDMQVWTDVSWSEATGVSSYILFKSSTPYGDYIAVDTVDETLYMDWPSEARHLYYKVKSLDGVRASEFSNFAHVYFSGILSAPDHMIGGDNGSSVVLYWYEVPYASEYDVYRGPDTAHMTLNQTVYTPTASDTPETAGDYYYGVVARTQGGLESPMTTPILVHFIP
jgi:fibronectin type 3 domain-containing protein